MPQKVNQVRYRLAAVKRAADEARVASLEAEDRLTELEAREAARSARRERQAARLGQGAR